MRRKTTAGLIVSAVTALAVAVLVWDVHGFRKLQDEVDEYERELYGE